MRAQFGRTLIPPAVLDELQIDSFRPGAEALKSAVEQEWIVVQDVRDAALIRTLRRDLDQGEAEAITLAEPIHDLLGHAFERQGSHIGGRFILVAQPSSPT